MTDIPEAFKRRSLLILAMVLEVACSKQRVPDERVAKVVYVDVKQDAALRLAPSVIPDAAAPAVVPNRP